MPLQASPTQTDVWATVATATQPAWESRAAILGTFVRSGDTVLDLGAGDQKLRRHLPAASGYIPVDCTDALPGTFVVDFNQEFRLPVKVFNVIIAAGFLEYVADLEAFMMALTAACSGTFFLFTYFYGNPQPGRMPEFQRYNHFSNPREALAFFRPFLGDVTEFMHHRYQSYFSGTLGVPEDIRQPRSLMHIIPKRRLGPPWFRALFNKS
jgi:hypothetical protein